MQNFVFNFSGLTIKASQPGDPDLLFDELIQKGNDHPDVIDERFPYWAEIWPSSLALCEFISENQELVKGKSVIEIGCGPGLPGIVAAMAGGHVELTDYMQEAIDLATHNWKLNFNSSPKTSLFDWREPGKRKADVILASDVAYESRSFAPLLLTLNSLINPGGVILLSEPNRKFTSAFFHTLVKNGFGLSEIKKKIVKDGIDYTISVYVLTKNISPSVR